MINIKTNNFNSAKRFISDTISRHGMGAVIGEKGSGKTHIRRQIIGELEEKKGTYRVIFITPMAGEVKCITQIMSAMIEDISGENPRRDTESRRRQLRRILGETSHDVILAIDEAQDLHKSTIRGLKKIHELGFGMRDRLFSIILMGQNSLKDKISDDELRPRIKRMQMKDLTMKEKELFIEKSSVFSDKALQIFLKRTRKTPLSVISAFDDVYMIMDDLNVKKITEQIVQDYFSVDRREALLSLNKSFREMAREIEEVTGTKVSATALNQHSKGLYRGKTDRLDEIIDEFLQKTGESRKIANA